MFATSKLSPWLFSSQWERSQAHRNDFSIHWFWSKMVMAVLLYLSFVCVGMCSRTGHIMWKSEDNPWERLLSFICHVSPVDGAQAILPDCKHLLSHLTDHWNLSDALRNYFFAESMLSWSVYTCLYVVNILIMVDLKPPVLNCFRNYWKLRSYYLNGFLRQRSATMAGQFLSAFVLCNVGYFHSEQVWPLETK